MGILALSYYKNVFFIIIKHKKANFAEQKQKLLAEQEELLSSGNLIEYKQLRLINIMIEEYACKDLFKELIEN